MTKKKKKLDKRKILSFFIILAGILLACYPWISNYVNQRAAESTYDTYKADVKNLTEEEYKEILQRAKEYNKTLAESNVILTDPFKETVSGDIYPFTYDELLNVNGTGVMGEVEIPSIDVKLPIYHGTDADVLEKGVGHLERSSLPVGGENTHAVLTGHTGLSTAKLFTDLNLLEKGDIFTITCFNQTIAYKVCDIYTVLPEDTSKLMIEEGKDLCTLVTCTPYGVNSHRLLVRGERTEYNPDTDKVKKHKTSESEWMKEYKKAILIGLLIILLLVILYKIKKHFDEKKRKKQLEKQTVKRN